MSKLKGLSLFANVGIAEAYFDSIGVDVVLANDLEERRMRFYKHLYPKTETITGDITDSKVSDEIISKSIEKGVDFIMATPPCQGMSLAGRRDPLDPRNQLISYGIEIIKKVKPRYVFLENVPQQKKTKISYNGESITIPEYVKKELENDYNFTDDTLIRCMDYSVPQMRSRNIYLLTRKDQKVKWTFPEKDEKVITLREAIGHLPSVDPLLREGINRTLELFPDFERKKEEALSFSKFHTPPVHSERHVKWMSHTPSGKTAFDNLIYFPQKEGGVRINGHYNTYRRQNWDKPSRTIIMNNGVISSLCCVHPGRLVNDSDNEELRQFSDPRVLTLAEIFIVSSLPIDWNVPDWENENFIRKVIGEGIPPLLVKKIFLNLLNRI